MQLDKANVMRLEKNGMIVAMASLYDQELDTISFEVTKTLTGQLLNRATYETRAEAEKHYTDLARELGATPQEIYYSKIK